MKLKMGPQCGSAASSLALKGWMWGLGRMGLQFFWAATPIPKYATVFYAFIVSGGFRQPHPSFHLNAWSESMAHTRCPANWPFNPLYSWQVEHSARPTM